MRPISMTFLLALLLTACGGAEPEAEATWETHTTDPDDDTAGGEGSAEETE